MAHHAVFALPLGPTSVPIHDDGNVLRHPIRIDPLL